MPQRINPGICGPAHGSLDAHSAGHAPQACAILPRHIKLSTTGAAIGGKTVALHTGQVPDKVEGEDERVEAKPPFGSKALAVIQLTIHDRRRTMGVRTIDVREGVTAKLMPCPGLHDPPNQVGSVPGGIRQEIGTGVSLQPVAAGVAGTLILEVWWPLKP